MLKIGENAAKLRKGGIVEKNTCGEWFKFDNLLRICLETGDEQQWSEFVRISKPVIAKAVINTVQRHTGRVFRPLVDDLVQDTYLKLCANDCRALREFRSRHEHAVYGFLRVVAVNVVEDYFRASFSQKRGAGSNHISLELLNTTEPRNSNVRTQVERQLVLHKVRCLLTDRPNAPNCRRDCTIFWLYYRYGLSSKEIATIAFIDLTVKGVESTILRLTQHLKEHFSTVDKSPYPRIRKRGQQPTPIR